MHSHAVRCMTSWSYTPSCAATDACSPCIAVSFTCLGPSFGPFKDVSMFRLRERKSSTATPSVSRCACVRGEEVLCMTLALAALGPWMATVARAQTDVALVDSASANGPAPAVVVGPIPFRKGFPVIINNNGPFTFRLNPGAPSAFYLSSTMAEELGLTVLTHGRYRLLDETSPSSGRYVDMVRIDDMRLAGAELHDLKGIATPQDNSSVVGIGAFHGYMLTLDYPHDKLTVSTERLANPDNLTVFHFVGDETTPVVPITLNGTPMTAHVEASAEDQEGDLMVPIELGKRLPLLTPLREDGFYSDGIGRTWLRFKSQLNGDLQVGALIVHNPTLIVSNRLSYINLAGICRRLLLRFDLDDRLVEIKLPAAPATQTAAQR